MPLAVDDMALRALEAERAAERATERAVRASWVGVGLDWIAAEWEEREAMQRAGYVVVLHDVRMNSSVS